MSQYFDEFQTFKSDRKEISFRFWCLNYTFEVDVAMFAKDHIDMGTRILLNAVHDLDTGKKLLDLGCGYGPIGIIMGKTFPDKMITMVDITDRAVEMTKENVKRNEVNAEVLKSNCYSALDGRRFDLILTNPPIRAGKKVIYPMFVDAYDHLNVGGRLAIVIRKNHGALSAKKVIEERFGNCEILNRDKGFYVLSATRK